MAKRLALDWAFEEVLEPRKEELRQALKPKVTAWANKMWPKLRKNLRSDRLAGCSTATDLFTATFNEQPLWVFVAMFVNRDIGDDVTAMVAASERTAHLMADSFFEAMHTRMGNPTQVFN